MRIIIGYDGSAHADGAMDDLRNAGLPETTEASVLCAADVFNVFEPAPIQGEAPSVMAEAAARWRADVDSALAKARDTAESGAARLRRSFPTWKILAEGVADSPGWALIERGEGSGDPARAADMIVVGAAGRSAIGRMVFGSVANQVLSNAGCPVRIGRRTHRADDEPVRLLVGVDGSLESSAAVERIISRSWPGYTECRVVAVVDSRMSTAYPPYVPFVASSSQSLAKSIVDGARARLQAAGIRATSAVLTGGAVGNLLSEAADYKAHCIFLGASGLGRVARLMLGSVSRSVSIRATCSVEVSRASAAER